MFERERKKSIFFKDKTTYKEDLDDVYEEDDEVNFTDISYDEMLRLNKSFDFPLSKNEIADIGEFNTTLKDAIDLLKQDLLRFGIKYREVDPDLINNTMGVIGALVVYVDKDEKKAKVRFHKRNKRGYWDGSTSMKYPEVIAETIEKDVIFKDERFFILEDYFLEDYNL